MEIYLNSIVANSDVSSKFAALMIGAEPPNRAA